MESLPSEPVAWFTKNESLLELSMKAVTLCALTRSCCSAELAAMDFDSIWFSLEGVRVLPIVPPKQARAESTIKDYVFSQFGENVNICPMTTVLRYCDLSKPNHPTGGKHLFTTTKMSFHPASNTTIARWIKFVKGGNRYSYILRLLHKKRVNCSSSRHRNFNTRDSHSSWLIR